MRNLLKFRHFENTNNIKDNIIDILSELNLEGFEVKEEYDFFMFDLLEGYDSSTLLFTIRKERIANIPSGSWMYLFKFSEISDTINRVFDYLDGALKLEIIYNNRLDKITISDYVENLEVYGAIKLTNETSHSFSVVVSKSHNTNIRKLI